MPTITNQPLPDALHSFRKYIDGAINIAEQYIKNQDSDPNLQRMAREIALVRTKLQEAKMWTGKCLEAIGSELPQEFRDKA